MAEAVVKRTPLEDVMVAMDVVDTLRHHQNLVDRELDSEGRRDRLIARLRGIYQAQGIEVTDAMLAEGVSALEEDRFSHSPPAASIGTRLAKLYVNRGAWLKPLILLLVVASLLAAFYYFAVARPAAETHAQLPRQLQDSYAEVVAVSQDQQATEQAQALLGSARAALKNNNMEEARAINTDLQALLSNLNQAYEIRIVSRSDERSGVWRIPDVNSKARNYYLIVEALTGAGEILQIPVTSEEDGEMRVVDRWGVRVDQELFNAVAADKQDDGIIQQRIVGRKDRGQLDPHYSVETSGATITAW